MSIRLMISVTHNFIFNCSHKPADYYGDTSGQLWPLYSTTFHVRCKDRKTYTVGEKLWQFSTIGSAGKEERYHLMAARANIGSSFFFAPPRTMTTSTDQTDESRPYNNNYYTAWRQLSSHIWQRPLLLLLVLHSTTLKPSFSLVEGT